MDVSIIIVNTNHRELLKQVITSVYNKTVDIDFEIIVADNCSTDGSQEMIRKDFPDVKIVGCENRGFGHANNAAANYSLGKYLFFLNPDTILLNNAVKILSDFLDRTPKAAICGGNLYTKDMKENLSYGYLPSIFGEFNFLLFNYLVKIFGRSDAVFNHSHKPIEVGYISGADLMIRKDLFLRVKGFDTDFFLYYEETELTYRIKKIGYNVFSVPEAKIIHLEGQSFTENKERRVKLLLASKRIYYQKTHNVLYRNMCYCIFRTGIFIRIIVFRILRNRKKYQYWLLWNKY